MAKRMSYSSGFKLKVVEMAIKNGNRSAGREYGGERRRMSWQSYLEQPDRNDQE